MAKCHNVGDCCLVTIGDSAYVVQDSYTAWLKADYIKDFGSDWKCEHNYTTQSEMFEDFPELKDLVE